MLDGKRSAYYLDHPAEQGEQIVFRIAVNLELVAGRISFLKLRLRRDDVVREVTANVGAIEGQISDAVKDQVFAMVKFATTLSNSEKAKILESPSA